MFNKLAHTTNLKCLPVSVLILLSVFSSLTLGLVIPENVLITIVSDTHHDTILMALSSENNENNYPSQNQLDEHGSEYSILSMQHPMVSQMSQRQALRTEEEIRPGITIIGKREEHFLLFLAKIFCCPLYTTLLISVFVFACLVPLEIVEQEETVTETETETDKEDDICLEKRPDVISTTRHSLSSYAEKFLDMVFESLVVGAFLGTVISMLYCVTLDVKMCLFA